MDAPISQQIIQPIAKSNILYVNSIEEFEAIPVAINETILAFDNNKECFYTHARDKYNELSSVKIYFYEDFATHMQRGEDKEFYDKCKALGYDKLKTEIAHKFFIENEKPQAVWLWLLETNRADVEWDTVRHMKSKMKKAFLGLENQDFSAKK